MSDNIQNVKIRVVGEADFSKIDQGFKSLSASEQALINQTKQLDTETQKTNTTIQSGAEKNKKATDETTKGFSGLIDKVKNLASQIPGAFQVQQVLGLASSVGTASKSVTGLSGTFNILKIAIASTGIGLLVVAVASLITYFTQTEAGGDKLAKVFGGLKSVFSGLINVLVFLGEKLAAVTSFMFDGFYKVYEFIRDQFIGAIRNVAGALSFLGFDDAAASVDGFADSVQNASDKMGEMYEMGQKLAEMEDALEDKTIKLALANAKLTTEIEQTLKALRNRTNTYQENLTLINKVSDAEQKRLNNNLSLINDEIEIERQRFLIAAENQEKAGQLYDEFVAGKIEADELIQELDGQNTAGTVKNIADILIKREEAFREELVLEERLNNLRDQFAQKEQQRQEARQKKILENLKAEEAFAVREAQLAGKSQADILAIQIEYEEKKLVVMRKFGMQDSNEFRDTLLRKQEFEQKYTASIVAAEKKLHEDIIKMLEEAEKLQEDVINKYALTRQRDMNAAELNSLKDLENQYLSKQISFQEYQDGIALIQSQAQRESIRNEIDTLQRKIAVQKSYGLSTTELEKALIDKQKALYDFDVEQYKNAEAKKTAEKQKATQKRQAIEQQAQQLANTLIQGFSQLQQQEYNNQLTALQAKQQAELAAVGDNKQAQAIINAKYAKQENEIKRRQAIAEKEQAVFSIGLSTAAAVIKQLASTPLPAGAPLIALVAATGAAQLAFAAAKPIPKFNKGTKRVPGVDTGDDSVLAMVRPGEKIFPVDTSNQYSPALDAIFDKKVPASLMNSIAMNYDRISIAPRGQENNRQLSEISNKLDKLTILNINMDQKGFASYISKGVANSKVENNYLNL